MTSKLSESDLKGALGKLRVAAVFSDAEVHELYLSIAAIYGKWLSEQEAMEVSPVPKRLRNLGHNLIDTSNVLGGLETGLRNRVDTEVTSQAIKILALDPTVGSHHQAQQLISELRGNVATLGHACLIAYADLSRKASNDGRAPLLWYDGFTALLLLIARKAGIEPNLNKDRANRMRGGWLFDAAQALEPFLDAHMRSPSPEACGKRLERSRKRLLNGDRQNPRGG